MFRSLTLETDNKYIWLIMKFKNILGIFSCSIFYRRQIIKTALPDHTAIEQEMIRKQKQPFHPGEKHTTKQVMNQRRIEDF